MLRIICITLLCICAPVYLYSSDKALIEETADHICKICSNKSKSRLAIYSFTNQEDKETNETKEYTTRIISIILGCEGIKVIDPSKVQAVMEEQSKGLLGIVDDETAPETGKLLGADTLVFGQVEKNIIQVRLIDASSGEILGATVEEGKTGKNVEVKVEKFNDEASKIEFRKSQLKKQLEFLFRNKPGVFLFMTSTDDEIAAFREKSSQNYERINRLLNNAPADKKEKFNRSRKMVLDIRKKDPKFNERIIKGNKTILSGRARPPRRRR